MRTLNRISTFFVLSFCMIATATFAQSDDKFTKPLDLSKTMIVIESGERSLVEKTAVTVLVEEIEKRTGIKLKVTSSDPKNKQHIKLETTPNSSHRLGKTPEAFVLATHPNGNVLINGFDAKGLMNGVGKFLRSIECRKGSIISPQMNIQSAPEHTIRGHQLGYRTTANSYDAWDVATYDQYIRELAIFGVNAIENIPLQDSPSEHMPITRQEMNKAMSLICQKYGVQYWVWTPATIDLDDAPKRKALLDELESFFQECPYLGAIFVPGGDPGHNHPKLVMPYLKELYDRLNKHHPEAKVWMSLQGFDKEQQQYFYDWLHEHQPEWFGGAVGGPSSPPLPELRANVPAQYPLRDYPDITHTVRSQHPTPWIDPAFAYTSGREGSNPEPVTYSRIFRKFGHLTDGFITYSDGMHDDVNKHVWSALGWDPNIDTRDAMIEYARFYFGPDIAEQTADAIYGLERNWLGPLETNGGVEGTLLILQQLDKANPKLNDNWRWQLLQLKAYYDAYIRARLIHEQKLEDRVNETLSNAGTLGVNRSIDRALATFAEADAGTIRPELREKIYAICELMFKLIGYQTHTELYGANAAQRGAVLNFVDHPLNNRWWVEDQFKEILALSDVDEQLARLNTIATWENPGPGSFYDDIGNVAKSPNVIRTGGHVQDPESHYYPAPDFMWWDSGLTRVRQSWISKMDWPTGMRYDGLDTNAHYTLRTTGISECLPRVNGTLVKVDPAHDGKKVGDVKHFPVPKELYKNGTMVVTFDVPYEPGINWRQMSRLTEIWLIKEP